MSDRRVYLRGQTDLEFTSLPGRLREVRSRKRFSSGFAGLAALRGLGLFPVFFV